MGSVSFQHVYKYYKGEATPSVNDFDLKIKDGEFLVLVGPSGCGKSTTLRMLAGLEEISQGDLYIDDRFINYVSPKDRDIAMVFQNYALYPNLSVYENMALGLKLRKVAKHEVEIRVKRAGKILEISHLLEKRPNQLSGGQKQRVALGRAIVREPQVFLMDEPLSNLDAKLRTQTRAEIIKLHGQLQTTTVYVTHDQTEAMTMGSRIVVMKDGIIQQVAAPQTVYDFPVNLFVAGFIGSPQMNLFEGAITRHDQVYYFETKRLKLKLPEKFAHYFHGAAFSLRQITMGIRSEHVVSDPFQIEKYADWIVNVTLDMKELMGSDTFLYVNSGESTIISRADAHTGLQEGDQIRVAFRMERAHFFNSISEVSIINQGDEKP